MSKTPGTTTMSIIHSFRLGCGATLVVEPMSGVRSAAISWLVSAGAARDPAGKDGLSTIWSEMLLRGSHDLSSREQADAFDRLGAGRSAESRTLTFRLGGLMLGERVSDVLPLLADMVVRPRFEEDALESSRDLALQALESLKDDPQEKASLLARSRHHADPLSRSGMGTEQGLNAISLDDVRRIWPKVATPAESIIGVAGNIDANHVRDRCEEVFRDWKGSCPEPAPGGPGIRGYAHETEETNQVQVILLHDAPTEASPDSLLEKVIVSVLSGGMAGRLFSEVREKRGLCYSVNAGYAGDRDFGTVAAYVGTTPERAQESLTVLRAELERINTPDGKVTPEEFQRAIVGLKSSLVFSGESTGSRAAAVAGDVRRLGYPRTLEAMAAAVDALTLERVNDYLARRTLGQLTIQTLGPAALTTTH